MKRFSSAKNLESSVYNSIVNYYELGVPLINSEPYDVVIVNKVFENIRKLISLKEGETIIDLIYKPTTNKTSYAKGNESKSDLVIITKEKVFKISIKKDTEKSYLISSNNLSDLESIFFNPLSIKYIQHDTYFKEYIMNIFKETISKIPKFDTWDIEKGTIENFVMYYLEKSGIKKIEKEIGAEKINEIKSAIVESYRKGNEYNRILKEREVKIKEMIISIFGSERKNDYYAKSVIFEMITGIHKFGEDSNCCCNFIVNSEGYFPIDHINCDYILKILEVVEKGKIGRLQNVPRKGLSQADWKLTDIQKIADSFATADLTFKFP